MSKASKKIQSVESKVENTVNRWLDGYGVQYHQKNANFHDDIDKALKRALSKKGGYGGNYPDAMLLLNDSQHNPFPVMIEYKGYQDKLVKLDDDGHVENINPKTGEPYYKNINDYAVNGAVHYCHAILQYTAFTQAIAIGVTGYDDEDGKLQLQIGVYYVAKSNYGMGQEVDKFSDLSFLKSENFDDFVHKVKLLQVSKDELKQIHKKREEQIEDALTRLNERLYGGKQHEITNINISALARIHLVSASIMANLGVPSDKKEDMVKPLQVEDLKSSDSAGEDKDGEIVMKRIKAFLDKRGIPPKKREQIITNLNLTLLQDDYSKPINGISLIKKAFTEVVEDLGYFYKVGLDTDFTGKLFNVMFRWLAFAGDDQNDVVLTPRYVATMMAKLAQIDKDSYVWDFATGSAGLLVAAMNEMILDARKTIKSEQERAEKEQHIRKYQILGLEVLPEIYMLAVLNMILMGDGSSNVLQGDSLQFNGNYNFGRENEKFPADVFVLNPPYSASGNGMIFVQKAIDMMDKGYAVVIIQDSAGSGKAQPYNKKILQKATLIASIKMPIDIFIGKSSVQTSIYVLEVGKKHPEKHRVRFIDFREDGYKRSNRKKAKASSNLQDVNNAVGRYEEVVNVALYGENELKLLNKNEFVEDTITVTEKPTIELTNWIAQEKTKLKQLEKDNNNPDEILRVTQKIADYQQQLQEITNYNAKIGADWNFDQHKKIETKPTLADFKKTVSDYLAWEVSQILKGQGDSEADLGKA